MTPPPADSSCKELLREHRSPSPHHLSGRHRRLPRGSGALRRREVVGSATPAGGGAGLQEVVG